MLGLAQGVNRRALRTLFAVARERSELYSYSFTVSMLEIYNECVRDMLVSDVKADGGGGGAARKKAWGARKTAGGLQVRHSKEGGVEVEGLSQVGVGSPAEVEDLIRMGLRNRAVGAHNVNEHSSRSHLVLTVYTTGRNLETGPCRTFSEHS